MCSRKVAHTVDSLTHSILCYNVQVWADQAAGCPMLGLKCTTLCHTCMHAACTCMLSLYQAGSAVD
jgi:hypothetical protein